MWDWNRWKSCRNQLPQVFGNAFQDLLTAHTVHQTHTKQNPHRCQAQTPQRASWSKQSLWALSLCHFLQAKKCKKQHKGSSPCQKNGDHKASPFQNWLQQQKSTLLGQKSKLVSPGDALNPETEEVHIIFMKWCSYFLHHPQSPLQAGQKHTGWVSVMNIDISLHC